MSNHDQKSGNQEEGKPSPRKRYMTVDEMVRELSEDPDFIAAYEKAIAESRIVGALVVARAVCGLKPDDVDVMAGLKPGTARRIERQKDDDCKVGELRRFASVVGCSIDVKVIEIFKRLTGEQP